MQPLISYCSAIMSPGLSCGRKEYALPQWGHQPSDIALPSSVDRPTGRPQFQQNRFDSATTGLVISASSGSFARTRGISTRPPPRRRVGDNARVAVVWSCGSVSPVPTDVPSESSSKCGRNTAWVAIGRNVAALSTSSSSRSAGWVPGPGLLEVLRMQLGHQPEYLATGGAGAGPSTVNHLRYKVFHVPSRRMRSSVPLTKRTSPVFCRLMPIP